MDVKNPAIDNEDTLSNKKMRFWQRANGPISSNISSKVVILKNFAESFEFSRLNAGDSF